MYSHLYTTSISSYNTYTIHIRISMDIERCVALFWHIFLYSRLSICLYVNRCRTSSNCTGFLLNYETESCSRVISNSPSSELRSQIRASARKVNYFEKVCLKGKKTLKEIQNHPFNFGYLELFVDMTK